MDKQSFYRYVNAYNHYKNNIETFDKFYNFPRQYNNFNFTERDYFLKNLEYLSKAKDITKFYVNKSVTNFLVQQEKFMFNWIKDKPIIFPYNNFFLQIELDNYIHNLFFHRNAEVKLVSLSSYKNDFTAINSNFYLLKNNYFDLQNLELILPYKKQKKYEKNDEKNHFYIWLIFIIFYTAIYEKQIFCVENNKNKNEKKLYQNSQNNYAEYKILKVKKKIYKNFLKNNLGKKQKSWHMVMSHLRQLQNGKITTVKAHTRGSKKIGIRLKDYEVGKGKKIHESI